MKLPVSGNTVAETVRFGTVIGSGVATAWAWKSGHRLIAGAFALVGLASLFGTKSVPSGVLAGVDDTETEEEDSLALALEEYCKDPSGTVAKVDDIETALKAQAADPSSDSEIRGLSIKGLSDISEFRRQVASGKACK